MNLKMKIVLFACVFISMGSVVNSQGVFKTNSKVSKESITKSIGVFSDESPSTAKVSSTAEAAPITIGTVSESDSDKPGGGGGDVPGEDVPVGDGFALLCLLSGSYIVLKKRKETGRKWGSM
jgi:hypothetical protein